MQYIDRNRRNSNGDKIEPDAAWFKASLDATNVLIQRGRKPRQSEFRKTYRDPKVKTALKELFNNKCAYCGCTLENIRPDVEHFRPKGKVEESPQHTGYYWLAYTWENLYPSCTYCNQERKRNHFPLEDETERAMQHTDAITREKPLLLDPCKDDPRNHIRYNMLGEPNPIKGSKKGKMSIKVYGLDRYGLNNLRSRHINLIKELIDSCNGDQSKIQRRRQFIETNAPGFSGLSDQIFERPYEFGL